LCVSHLIAVGISRFTWQRQRPNVFFRTVAFENNLITHSSSVKPLDRERIICFRDGNATQWPPPLPNLCVAKTSSMLQIDNIMRVTHRVLLYGVTDKIINYSDKWYRKLSRRNGKTKSVFIFHTINNIFVSHSNNLLDNYIIYQNSVVSLLEMSSKRQIVNINYWRSIPGQLPVPKHYGDIIKNKKKRRSIYESRKKSKWKKYIIFS